MSRSGSKGLIRGMQGNSNESIRRPSTKDLSIEEKGKEETGKCAIG
jgi:hypothetical protein